MWELRNNLVLFLLAIHTHDIGCVQWEHLHCAPDNNQDMTEGSVADIGRFPWLGVVQHAFYVGGKTHYAVTGAVLIHPGFAIAAAEDIAKISPDQIVNNTNLIVWDSSSHKYVLEVKDYILHPQYHERVTFATIALLDFIAWGDSSWNEWKAPVLPICMPVKGSGTLEQIYAVKMSDAYGSVEKEIVKMKYVGNQACEEFYYKSQLSYTKMNPVNPLCAVSEFSKTPCVWDSGTVLITRQSWGFWKLLGFAVRGPGCGAPTRFLNIHDYLPWINDVISGLPLQDSGTTYKLGVRRQNPYELIIYKAGVQIPKHYGVCERGPKKRGTILFKDSQELLLNKNFVQGFYFLVVTMMAEFACMRVDLDVSRQSNAAVWLEHNCHRDAQGAHVGFDRPQLERANLDISVYGQEHKQRRVPNPFKSTQYTTPWWPTPNRLKMGHWVPVAKWFWYL